MIFKNTFSRSIYLFETGVNKDREAEIESASIIFFYFPNGHHGRTGVGQDPGSLSNPCRYMQEPKYLGYLCLIFKVCYEEAGSKLEFLVLKSAPIWGASMARSDIMQCVTIPAFESCSNHIIAF